MRVNIATDNLPVFTFLGPSQLWALVPFIHRLTFVWLIKKTWAEKEITSVIWHESRCGRAGSVLAGHMPSPLPIFHLRSWVVAPFSAETRVFPGIPDHLQESIQCMGLENNSITISILLDAFYTLKVHLKPHSMKPTEYCFRQLGLL